MVKLNMSPSDKLLGIAAAFIIFSALLYVVFGQVTVRKLRKKPEVKDKLGLQFVSGWDILNVAGALSRPKWLSERLRQSPLALTAADERPLYEHTNLLDRFLARLFFYTWTGSVVSFFIIALLAWLGVIE